MKNGCQAFCQLNILGLAANSLLRMQRKKMADILAKFAATAKIIKESKNRYKAVRLCPQSSFNKNNFSVQ